MFGCCLLEFYLFVMRDRKGMDLAGKGSGKELGGLEGRKSIIRTYCTRRESMFYKRKTKRAKIYQINHRMVHSEALHNIKQTILNLVYS